MKAKKKALSIIWWIVAYAILLLGLFIGFRRPLASHDIVDWISVFGVYTTFFSLVLMFVQFKSIRKVSEETKNKLNKTVAVSDLSKYSELIRSLEVDVRKDNIDVALYKTQNIKEIVHKNKILEKIGNGDEGNNYELIFSILATHINSYNEKLLSEDSELNKSVILKELEVVTSFFQKKSNEMINNIE